MSDERAESWFGCFTGDCPHETRAECDAAIRAEMATLESTVAALDAANAQLRTALLDAERAMLAALDKARQRE
jgi:hypothetical protein